MNNIIVTLDADTEIKGKGKSPERLEDVRQVSDVKISLPGKMNSIGLIDGQHRTFACYVSEPDDPDIAKMRADQNLFVTGISGPWRW